MGKKERATALAWSSPELRSFPPLFFGEEEDGLSALVVSGEEEDGFREEEEVTMKVIAGAYVLLQLEENRSPSAKEIKDILVKYGAVAEADDDDKIQLLLSQAEGKALNGKGVVGVVDAFKAAFDLRDGKLGAAAEAKKGKVEESDDGLYPSKSMAAVSISSDSQPSDQSPPSQMSAEEKFIIVRSIGEECIQDEELRNLLANKPQPICYDGFEPSGRMHIAQGVMKAINVNKLTSAGCKVKFWIADRFAKLNKKMGGDLRKIKVVGEYFIEIWKVVGMNIDEAKVEFLWSSEETRGRKDEYLDLVLDIAMRNNLARITRCCQIMGRSDQDELTAAQFLYPLMQCADIFFLKADICQMGMDQRKVNMLAREYCDDIKRKNKPIILSHHMLPGLQQGQEKMSKSDPSSSIFMEDEEADVNVKIKKAYCPPEIVAGNPCLEYIKYIVLPWFNEFTIERSADNGGPKTFTSFEELALDYESGAVHPGDLKPSLSKALNQILQPVRDHFKNNEKARDLIKKVKGYKVTK